MPTYHYRCSDCGHSFDFFQKFADDPLTVCPECEGPIRRVPQPVGIVFKGSGWYVNDSRNAKNPTSTSKSDSSDKSSDSNGSAPKESSKEAAKEVKASAAAAES
ncbi:MAG: FmdB family zinc ribbon protein [Thermomicrobiales bacterium]